VSTRGDERHDEGMMDVRDGLKGIGLKSYAKVLILLCIIASAELLIMVSFPLLGVPVGFWEDSLDTLCLTAITAPFIFKLFRAEVALKASEARFKGMVEESLVGAYIVQDGRFVYLNSRFAEMFGYTKEEVYGLADVMDLVHPDDRRTAGEALELRYTGKTSNVQYQLRGIKKDKGVIDVEVVGWRTEYFGRPAAIGRLLDITERKMAEAERSAMFHMLTHDIKGPLSIIYGYGELIAQKTTDPDNAYMADEINKAARRISLLINDMLELSRMESGQAVLNMEPVSLTELFNQAISENGLAAEEMGIKVGVEVDEDMPLLRADKTHLGRAISNLVANAVNYNRQGGSVTVRGGVCGAASDRAFVEVSDTGVGISEEDLPRIFDRYFRSAKNRLRRGTGLGLAIVKAVADAHGGTVHVESREGEGATFRLELPLGAVKEKNS
jgi:PAS domain S-box-containing protein